MRIRNSSSIVQDILEAMTPSTGQSHQKSTEIETVIRQALALSYPNDANPRLINASIMMADIRGFTSLSEEQPPVELMTLLNVYFSSIVDVIIRYNGMIDKFIGDAVMVVFPADSLEDVLNTLRCAIDIQREIEAINVKLEKKGSSVLHMGIGINTGEVVAGCLGSPQHQELTVIGSHVNLASRVESYSMRGQVLISSNTYGYCADHITPGSVYDVQPKGKKETIKVYELISINTPEVMQIPRISRRRYTRVEIEMGLKFNIVDGKHLSMAIYDAKTIDISYTGIGIVTKQELKPLMEIRIILSLSLLGPDVGEIYAKVNRIENIDGFFHAGLEFTTIDATSLKNIKAYIDKNVARL
jgi:adenylate cyclase